MKFRDFYNILYKLYEEGNIFNYYRIRVDLVSGLTVYEGAIENNGELKGFLVVFFHNSPYRCLPAPVNMWCNR